MAQEARLPEPWLRGPLPGVPPVLAAVIHALMQTGEDLFHFTEGLSEAEIWSQPHGMAPLGFHLRHIAGSLDRLTTYLEGGSLAASQIEMLSREHEPGEGREALLSAISQAIAKTSAVVSALPLARLDEPRYIGRKRIATTAVGLAIHIAEHTQRHTGQAITTCRLIQAMRA